MKRVLIAVEDTKGADAIFSAFQSMVNPPNEVIPEEVILLHVERLEGKSLMTAMLGEAELATLKESLRGTEYKEALDRKAEKILGYYKNVFETGGMIRVKSIIREGNPGEEILKAAKEESVELIILGSGGEAGVSRLITGSTGREVERGSRVPVLIAKRAGKKAKTFPEKTGLEGFSLRDQQESMP